MAPDLKGLATLPFDGDARKGPRHTYIISQLLSSGSHPVVDNHGNIWVESSDGSGEESDDSTILVSSHMDVDPRIKSLAFSSFKEGGRRMVQGVLDNSVGCLINLRLAALKPKSGRRIHVFTASEEVEKDNPRKFCRSAREIVRELRSRGITPDFCAVIDVTFPRLLVDAIDWSKPYHDMFDTSDRTHCFLDGYSRHSEKKLVLSLLDRVKGLDVKVRYLHGHDEAFVYSRLCHSFAFGPVVYGDFAESGQKMPIAHMETAFSFLKKALGYV
jgi:hypothetical protein